MAAPTGQMTQGRRPHMTHFHRSALQCTITRDVTAARVDVSRAAAE
jgi:hypothetical protein